MLCLPEFIQTTGAPETPFPQPYEGETIWLCAMRPLFLKNVSFWLFVLFCSVRDPKATTESSCLSNVAPFAKIGSRDTLHRHELSHHTMGPEGGKDHAHRITVKTFRACFKCAAARVRCSGGTPCGRCDIRSLSCVYPTERRSKAKSRKDSSQKSPPVNEEEPRHSNSQQAKPPENVYNEGLGQQAAETTFHPSDPRMSQFRVQLGEQNIWDRPSGTSAGSGIASQRASQNEGLHSHFGGAQAPSGRPTCPTDMTASHAYKDMPTVDGDGTYLSGQAAGRGSHFQLGGEASTHIGPEMSIIDHDGPFPDSTALSMNWLSVDIHPHAASNSSSLLATPSEANLNHVTPQGHPSAATPLIDPLNSLASKKPPRPSPGITSQRADAEWLSNSGQMAADSPSYPRIDIAPEYKHGQAVSPKERGLNPLLGFLPTQVTTVPAPWKTPNERLDRSMYREIHSNFIQLCCTENLTYQTFRFKDFPSADTLTNCIHFYFDSFQHVYPIFHPATFNPNACHWLVALAVASVGSQYAGVSDANQLASVFHEFLRRALNVEVKPHILLVTDSH